MSTVFQSFITAWSVDIAFGWSIMDIAGLFAFMIFLSAVLNYFFFKADTK